MFSVLPPTYSLIYSEKYALYLGKFWSRVEVFQGLLLSSYSKKVHWVRGWEILETFLSMKKKKIIINQ